MEKKSKPNNGPLFPIPKASAAQLRGRQSIRTSFKLSPKCIEAVNILGSHLRLMPKSLFDHLVQERKTLEAIASKTKEAVSEEDPRVAKTFVISRDASEVFSEVARRWKIPRDALVEASIQHLMPLIQKEQIRHDSRKLLFVKMERHLKGARKLFEDMSADLGDSDPMCANMSNVVTAYERAFAAIGEFIKKGESIEGFESDK